METTPKSKLIARLIDLTERKVIGWSLNCTKDNDWNGVIRTDKGMVHIFASNDFLSVSAPRQHSEVLKNIHLSIEDRDALFPCIIAQISHYKSEKEQIEIEAINQFFDTMNF